jgi:hypothetical protein
MIAIVALGFFGACGDKSCEELCTEAQAGDCTSIQGSCGSFCGALDTIEGPSGCGDERSSYEECLNGTDDVCDAGCGSQENALSACVQAYCVGHASDPPCTTLAGSF